MDLLKLYQDEDTSSDHLSSDSPGTDELLEDQPIPPRIGDEFQVVLPHLERRLQLSDEAVKDTDFPLKLGLYIPVTWVLDRNEHEPETLESRFHGAKTCAIPAVPATAWTDDEMKIFLLGLYIFGKNLVQVQRFMEGKSMGEILSFYYGRFYRSDAHRRWSECRKMRSRRHIYGLRIFSGWRHNELLQRLDRELSDASRVALIEATKALSECKASLEEYVSALKAAVGLKALVQAVGIGIENYDLTGLASDPAKATHGISTRAEIPAGKACSSLTAGDIVKFLTGDFRLSKAKSNDLFWEAVWPRLLAKGWHSEQPKGGSFGGGRHPLVFLLPTVKKFSRKLVKGKHYFDSVSDVLNEVATDPRLLELEAEGLRVDHEWVNGEENGSTPGQRNHLYLRPRLPSFNTELMKFTVVDTSLVNTEPLLKVCEMRSLPVDPGAIDYGPSSPCEVDSENSETSLTGVRKHRRKINVEGKPESTKRRTLTDEEDFQLCDDGKNEKPSYLSPVSKRQRLTACRHPESVLLALTSGDVVRKPLSEATAAEDAVAAGREESNECVPRSSCLSDSGVGEAGMLCEIKKADQPRALIDLNLPQFPPDFDCSETVNAEVVGNHHQPWDPNPAVNARRQSTRNRPLTTRALEALASGFLATRQKGGSRPSTKTKPSSRAASRTSRSSYKTMETLASATTVDHGSAVYDLTDAKVETVDEEYSSRNPNPNLP